MKNNLCVETTTQNHTIHRLGCKYIIFDSRELHTSCYEEAEKEAAKQGFVKCQPCKHCIKKHEIKANCGIG
ncbi:MAG: hypothetical protein ACRDA4_08605 [Filifactoraceae bacterium]